MSETGRPRSGLLLGQGPAPGRYITRYPLAERSLVRVLADRAAERPDQDWLSFDSTLHLTYGEAWATACQVGRALDRDGLAPGVHVGLLLRNQPEFVTSFYGVMARGGVVVPLNAESRGPLLQSVVERGDLTALVVRADLLEKLEELEGLGQVRLVVVVGPDPAPATLHGIPVRSWEEWLAGVPAEAVWPFPGYDDICLIQYTSGTTANQKGGVYPHHFLYLYSAMVAESLGRGEDDIWTTPMPLYHVAALHIITNTALHAGATSHLKSRFSASQFWSQAAADRAVFGIILGPMAAMVQKMTPDPVPEHSMTHMFVVPPPPELDAFEKRFHVDVIWQGFGMTEIYPLPMPRRQEAGVPLDTLGHPVSWMEYGAVDEHDEMVPAGELGELVFRPRLPHSMIRGYHRDPERTVEAFRNFMFHTGDLGFIDEAGRVHYRGRRQERIRRRGENIAAAEVEWVALLHPVVVEAAAYGVPSELGEEEVKLDLVLASPLILAELHGWLVSKLPRYMVPRYLEVRQFFPKTPSERVEKYRFKDQALDRPEVFDAEGAARPQLTGEDRRRSGGE